jgi:hypothetical protein
VGPFLFSQPFQAPSLLSSRIIERGERWMNAVFQFLDVDIEEFPFKLLPSLSMSLFWQHQRSQEERTFLMRVNITSFAPPRMAPSLDGYVSAGLLSGLYSPFHRFSLVVQ